jgi:hypothetical protein
MRPGHFSIGFKASEMQGKWRNCTYTHTKKKKKKIKKEIKKKKC